MTVPLSTANASHYAVASSALRRWARERLHRRVRSDGSVVYTFCLSGSTCNSRPIEVIMTVVCDTAGRIESATAAPAPGDTGCATMCIANCGEQSSIERFVSCDEAIGLTLGEAAFQKWQVEPSGCFCTSGSRLHKWRNVFQTLHYAATHLEAQPQGLRETSP